MNGNGVTIVQRKIVLCDLLCFVTYYNKKLSLKVVKNMFSEFYTPAAVTGAKDRLLSDNTAINLDNFVSPVAIQNASENKFKNEVDDIFILLQFIDEKELGEQSPVYVSNKPMKKLRNQI